MVQTFESNGNFKLKAKLNPADTTMIIDTEPNVTKGRLFGVSATQFEYIEFDGIATVATGYELTITGRNLSTSADPITTGTGKTWRAGQSFILVAMHDQITDKNEDITWTATNTFKGRVVSDGANSGTLEPPAFATLVALQTALPTGLGLAFAAGDLYHWNTATIQWEIADVGTPTPNASETVAGKTEEATQVQNNIGTDTGETGARTFATPSKNAVSIQNQVWTYATDTGVADAYVITLTPAPTALVAGAKYTFKATNANTGASTLNVNGLGVQSIVKRNASALQEGDILASDIITVTYDGTNLVLTERLVSNDISARTAITTLAGTEEFILNDAGTIKKIVGSNLVKVATGTLTGVSRTTTSTTTEDIVLGFIPKLLILKGNLQGHTEATGTNLATYVRGFDARFTGTGNPNHYSWVLSGETGATFSLTNFWGQTTGALSSGVNSADSQSSYVLVDITAFSTTTTIRYTTVTGAGSQIAAATNLTYIAIG